MFTTEEKILNLVNRIDQHIDVMEEKIDTVVIRNPSPISSQSIPEFTLSQQVEEQKRRMEQMMAMMEQMRIEKEYQEKLREEEKKYQEKKELEDIHNSLRSKFQNGMDGYSLVKAVEKLLQNDESMLVFFNPMIQNNSPNGKSTNIPHIITNRNIYSVYDCNLRPIYTFSEPLNKKYLLFLSNVGQRLSLYATNGNTGNFYHNQRNIESLLRAIPGSYQNGNWKQLDGFFGMYLNEHTMEFSDIPPVLK